VGRSSRKTKRNAYLLSGDSRAWNFFQKGVREGIFIFGVSGGNELDLSGRIAMVVRSTGSLGYLIQNAKFDLRATTMPGQVKEVVPIGGAKVFMFSARPQAAKDASWEFLKFLTATENTKRWSLATGYMTSRISAFESPEIQKIMTDDPRFALTYHQLETALLGDLGMDHIQKYMQ
jgi:sn-glycerol 3-phosphate transport system substrate-binding protein